MAWLKLVLKFSGVLLDRGLPSWLFNSPGAGDGEKTWLIPHLGGKKGVGGIEGMGWRHLGEGETRRGERVMMRDSGHDEIGIVGG